MHIVIECLAGVGALAVAFVLWLACVTWSDQRRRKQRKRVEMERRRRVSTQKTATVAMVSPPPSPHSPIHRPASAPQQRKPANPNVPRVRCDVCNKMITLTKRGLVHSHGSQGIPCNGSGKRYVDYVIHEDPV